MSFMRLALFFCLFATVCAAETDIPYKAAGDSPAPPIGDDVLLLVLTSAEHFDADGDDRRQLTQSAERCAVQLEVAQRPRQSQDAEPAKTDRELLRDALTAYKDGPGPLVVVSVGPLVVVNRPRADVAHAFRSHFGDARVVFGATPDARLAESGAIVVGVGGSQLDAEDARLYVSGGVLAGYADALYGVLTSDVPSPQAENDETAPLTLQDFLRRVYADRKLREKYRLSIDVQSTLLFTLDDDASPTQLEFDFSDEHFSKLTFNNHTVVPSIIKGSEKSHVLFNHYANYIGNRWGVRSFGHNKDSVSQCDDENASAGTAGEEGSCAKREQPASDEPLVTLSVVIPKNGAPFLEEFFTHLTALRFPAAKLDLIVYNQAAEVHAKFLDGLKAGWMAMYRSVELVDTHSQAELAEEAAVRDHAIDHCLLKKCKFLFNVDADAHISNPDTLRLLLDVKRDIVTPMMARGAHSKWTTFWSLLSDTNYYGESEDYGAMLDRERKGLYNVPFIRLVYLISADVLPKLRNAHSHYQDMDADMGFCRYCREKGYFMWIDNRHDYGSLVDVDDYHQHAEKVHPELYEMINNPHEWEARYIDPQLLKLLADEDGSKVNQPCRDVFDFPLFTVRFCLELLEECEHFGKWSSGDNKDDRLEGGYENVPTRDIHMKQIGLDEQFRAALEKYVAPMQEMVYEGFYKRPIETHMMFVVRFRADEQPSLRPHNDASTYSIDVALNRRGIDFQGGGVRFVRQNCSVLDHKQGWSLIFPGRLTHQHEGLPTTSGTRYVGVAFINP